MAYTVEHIKTLAGLDKVLVTADTVDEMPEPEESWAVGSTCEVLENGGSKFRLSNSGDWVETPNFSKTAGRGDLSQFTSEQIAEDYEFATTGGANIIFSFDADEYEKVRFTAYAGIPEGSGGGSMVFGLYIDIVDPTTSGYTMVDTLASFVFDPDGRYCEQKIEIDCTGMSGTYIVRSSGGGSLPITFGAKNIKGVAKSTKTVTDALNYLDKKIGDLTNLDSVKICADKTYSNLNNQVNWCTFDTTNLDKISFTASVAWDMDAGVGGLFEFWIGKESPEVRIGVLNEGGTQKEVVGRLVTGDCSSLTGEYSLFVTGGANGSDKLTISDFYGYKEHSDVVTGVNRMVDDAKSIAKEGIGDVSELSTMLVTIPVANEYKNGSTTGGIVGGSIFRLDVTNYSKLQMKIETEGTNSSFKLWFGPYGNTDVIVEIGSNESEFVEIDCSGLSGEYEIAFTIANCGRWSDIVAHRIIGKNTVDAINATVKGIDISYFGEKSKLAEDFTTWSLSGYKKVATVSLTGVDVLTFTGEIFSVGNASHSIMIAPAGDLPANSANVIFEGQLRSDDWNRKKYKVDVSAYSGNYEIWIVGGGSGYHDIRYTDICSFKPIQVDDIADALNYLLSLHN